MIRDNYRGFAIPGPAGGKEEGGQEEKKQKSERGFSAHVRETPLCSKWAQLHLITDLLLTERVSMTGEKGAWQLWFPKPEMLKSERRYHFSMSTAV